jgi:hypothetical protein
MALLGTINKQVREVVDFDIDYATVLTGRGAETITTCSSEVTPTGLTVSAPSLAANKAKCTISAGTNSGVYTVTVLATSSAGLIYEDEIAVTITNVS